MKSTWSLRAFVGLSGVCLMIIGTVSPASAKPKVDQIVGSGAAGGGTFEIDAVENKKGVASGQVTFELAIGSLKGDVVGVTVSSPSQGCATARITQSDVDGAPAGTILILHVAERTADHNDLVRLELTGTDDFSPECNFSMVSPAALTAGALHVVDGLRP